MRQQNIEISSAVFDWYSKNFQSARQAMGRVVAAAQNHLDKHPVADLFKDPINGMDFMLQAWKNIYRSSLISLKGIFTRDELSLFITVYNGTMLSPGHFANDTLTAAVSDSLVLNFSAEQWDVDSKIILEKIHNLTPTQAICVELWAVGYWHGVGSDPSSEKKMNQYIDQLA